VIEREPVFPTWCGHWPRWGYVRIC